MEGATGRRFCQRTTPGPVTQGIIPQGQNVNGLVPTS